MSYWNNSDQEAADCWRAAVWGVVAAVALTVLFLAVHVSRAEAAHDHSFVPQPPARYDRLPDNYVIKPVTLDTLRIACRQMTAIGCAVQSPLLVNGSLTPCMILYPNDAYPHLKDQIIRHEFGHCNGWHKSHPK